MIRRFSFAFDRAVIGTVLTGFAAQAALVVSGVLVARNLGPLARGQLALVAAIAVAIPFIAALGLPSAVAFTIARGGTSMLGVLRALRRWTITQAVTVFIASTVAILLMSATPSIEKTALIFAPITSVAWIVNMYGLAVLQGQSRFMAFNILRMLPAFGYAVGAVAVVVGGLGSVSAFVIAWSASNLLTAAAIVVVVWRDVRTAEPVDLDTRELVTYGVKAQVGAASPLETFQLDQLVVGAIAGPVALGFYVIGSAFMNLPRFIAQSLGMVAFPRVAGRLASGGARNVMVQALYATVLLAGGVVLVLELAMGQLIPLLFGSAYESAVPVARILLVGAFCFSLRRVLSDGMRGANNPLAGTIAEIIGWGVYALTVVPLTLKWHAKGGALAVALAAAIALAYIALAARRMSRRGNVGLEPPAAMTPSVLG